MSNVRIEATGEESLSIDVTLGGNVRKTWPVEAGSSIDLTVEGNQKLLISAVAIDETIVPTATLQEGANVAPDLPIEPEDFDVNTDGDDVDTPADEKIGGVIDDREEEKEPGDEHGFFDIPESEDEKEDVGETEVITPEDVGETVTIGPEDVGSIDIFDLPADAAIQIEQPFADEGRTEA